MVDAGRHTTLGRRTRKLLEQANGISKEHLDGIEAGNYTWSIEEDFHVPGSHTSWVADKHARDAAGRDRGFRITIYPTEQHARFDDFGEDGIAVGGATRQLGQDIISTHEREAPP